MNHANRRSTTVDPTKIVSTLVRTGMCRIPQAAAHRPAPSLFIYPGLTAKPVWKIEDVLDSSSLDKLKVSIDQIEQEYIHIKTQVPSDYTIKTDEHTLHKGGSWDWYSFVSKGKIQVPFQLLCPVTSSIMQSIPNLLTNVPFAYSFFSNLRPNTHISPHFGPCNVRLRIHYPLRVPSTFSSIMEKNSSRSTTSKDNSSSSLSSSSSLPSLGMKIADQILQWERNQPIVFDDTYEHSVWNNTTEDRVVLLFDIWHPELSIKEKEGILNMFQEAYSKGWITS